MKSARKVTEVWSSESDHAYMLQRILRADAWNRRTLRVFAEWLSSVRSLKAGTIAVRIDSASTFVDSVASRAGCSCARAFRAITIEEIEDFFIAYGKDHGKAALRSMQAAMRLFLRFAGTRG